MDEDLLLTEENDWTLDTDNEQQNWQTANPLISPHNESIGMPPIATSPQYINDPNGGVIVIDIFGGEHHYMDMNQAQLLTDMFSGLPSSSFTPMPQTTCGEKDCHLPTDIHTPNDLTFYDEKIEEAQRQLNRALEDATKTTDARALEDALTRQRQAKNDIEYWNRCRSQANYDQTVSHIKSDSIINKANEALNNLHDTLHHK